MIDKCDHCLEWKQLTHRVTSDQLRMLVCYECGINAELIQSTLNHAPAGNMRVTLINRPTVIPLFFECSVCHGRYTGERGYEQHWHERHA
mgnify:CR=1 FL=1